MTERNQPDQLALAMKRASVVRMVALAAALHNKGQLTTVLTPTGVKRPATRELRVKSA